MSKTSVNEPQARAIIGAAIQPSGFTLIQGPPGTGKTKTILALMGYILSNNHVFVPPNQAVGTSPKSNHILCCAPSNAAIDEIVRRLKDGILDREGVTFLPKIVRIGY